MTFDQWKTDVTGKRVGPGDSNGQCVGLAYDYVTRCIGSNFIDTNHGPHAGYAIGSWDSGLVPAGMTRLPGSDIRAGDVVFCNWGTFPWYQTSHVLVATGPVTAFMIPCLSQNSPQQWAAVQTLPAQGVAGVWRPANGTAGISNGGNSNDPLGLPSLPQGGGIGGVTGMIDTVNKLSAAVSNPALWKRIGLFALGAVLLYAAATMILAGSGTVKDITKGLTS